MNDSQIRLHVEERELGDRRFTRHVRNTEGYDRLVRTSMVLGRFDLPLKDGDSPRKAMHFWGICDLVANAVLAAIAEGVDRTQGELLCRRANTKLKERCGPRFSCTKVRWEQEALAYSANIVIEWPPVSHGKGHEPEAEWKMLLWDAAQAAQDFARYVLPACAPPLLLSDSYEIDQRLDYATARRVHAMSDFAVRQVEVPDAAGHAMLEVSALLYGGRAYARRAVKRVPVYYL